MNNQNDIRTQLNYLIRRTKKMSPFNFHIDPDNIARVFSQSVKAIVHILLWATIGLASLAAACVVLSGIWAAVKFALKAIF
jgi:hypothetical protein